MESSGTVGQFIDNCCEIKLGSQDITLLQLDIADVLLEIRPKANEYGVFYTAKGRQWDIWCHSDDDDVPTGVEFAVRQPIEAVRNLLKRRWRADFAYDPNEDD